MKILFITYFFEPDLSAGSFRNTSLLKSLITKLKKEDSIEVITTHPNRYDSYRFNEDPQEDLQGNVIINKIKMPNHGGGILNQIKSFKQFYFKAFKIINKKNYDLVYASSSKLFSAFLGARIARKKKAKLYLDIRDIFRETVLDIYKNPILKFSLNLLLKPIENYTFKNANHINLVSKGFESYFNYRTKYSFYTNGIDPVFLTSKKKNDSKKIQKRIVYAGNIGEGQGLHIIIPELAQKLINYEFIIIGDGGCKNKLITTIQNKNIKNVKILPPVNRVNLIKEYQKADFLFLHLNKYKAFERVLPSKLFEYATFDIPLIAGVAGYASEFLKENVSNILIFEPLNTLQLIEQLHNYYYKKERREKFIINYNRNTINSKMADSIISTI